MLLLKLVQKWESEWVLEMRAASVTENFVQNRYSRSWGHTSFLISVLCQSTRLFNGNAPTADAIWRLMEQDGMSWLGDNAFMVILRHFSSLGLWSKPPTNLSIDESQIYAIVWNLLHINQHFITISGKDNPRVLWHEGWKPAEQSY
jgi:hypothetical protein